MAHPDNVTCFRWHTHSRGVADLHACPPLCPWPVDDIISAPRLRKQTQLAFGLNMPFTLTIMNSLSTSACPGARGGPTLSPGLPAPIQPCSLIPNSPLPSNPPFLFPNQHNVPFLAQPPLHISRLADGSRQVVIFLKEYAYHNNERPLLF